MSLAIIAMTSMAKPVRFAVLVDEAHRRPLGLHRHAQLAPL